MSHYLTTVSTLAVIGLGSIFLAQDVVAQSKHNKTIFIEPRVVAPPPPDVRSALTCRELIDARKAPRGAWATGCDCTQYVPVVSENTGDILYWTNSTCPGGAGGGTPDLTVPSDPGNGNGEPGNDENGNDDNGNGGNGNGENGNGDNGNGENGNGDDNGGDNGGGQNPGTDKPVGNAPFDGEEGEEPSSGNQGGGN